MKKCTLILLLFTTFLHAQDIVNLTDGSQMNILIEKETPESIAFRRGKAQEFFYVLKNEIDEIKYADGRTLKIPHHEISLEEAKANIVKLINENALEEKSGRQFRTSFEDDFLRMIVLSAKSGEERNEGLLFDLSHVYQFDPLSYRGENRAYINLWTDRVRWPDRKGKERMDKIKLIMRVNDTEKATLLFYAFVDLHKALKKEKQSMRIN